MTKNAIVWTKTSSSPSREAVVTLRKLGYTVEERNVSLHRPWTIADLKAAIPSATTVPQIVIDDVAIGGLEGIANLPEAQAAAETRAAANAARAQRPSGQQRQDIQQRKADWQAARAAEKATAREAADAIRSAQFEARHPSTGTRVERHAAVNAVIAERIARRAAAQPVPPVAPEGYQICAPSAASPEHKAMRAAEKTAKAAADRIAWKDATREDRHAKYDAIKSRIYAKIEEQKAALS
jgi:glutaredoxin